MCDKAKNIVKDDERVSKDGNSSISWPGDIRGVALTCACVLVQRDTAAVSL